MNDEALTRYELEEQKRAVLGQMRAANVRPPAADVFESQMLERLIIDRALLQFAKENGVRIDDQTVERTILRIAQENKLTPEELRRALDREKISYGKYREDIRREVTIQRLREREVDSRVQVSEAEVDNHLATVAAQGGGENEYLLAHIMVGVPEQATPDQIAARQRRAEEALTQIKGGKEFREVAAAYSDAQDAISGRRPRMAHVGAPADGVPHAAEGDEEGRRFAGDAQPRRLSHRQAERRAQPQRALGGGSDARAAYPRARQRGDVRIRSQGQDGARSGSASKRAPSSPTRRASTPRTRRRPRAAISAGSIRATPSPSSSRR